MRCREVVGGQGPGDLHINGVVEAVVSRRTGVVKRVSHRRHGHRSRADALALIALGRTICRRRRGRLLRTKL